MNTQEAAARLGLSREYIQRLCNGKVIEAKKIGMVYQISARAVDAFAKLPRKRGPKAKVKQ